MSKESVLELLDKAAKDDSFILELAEDFNAAVADFSLTAEESDALYNGNLTWLEIYLGPLAPDPLTWPQYGGKLKNWQELEFPVKTREEVGKPANAEFI
ncbi:MAG: hypothetical protein JW860_10415 [Sedimentisphaerales bacterium]|nr:hypothetical protein [Sedimentisphaerales bacterium]